MFHSISNFRSRIAALLKVKCGVYAGVNDEVRAAFRGMTIEQIRNNRDIILVDEPLVFTKLRLPDRKHRLSKKDGPAQQLTISDNDLADLVEQYLAESQAGKLEEFEI